MNISLGNSLDWSSVGGATQYTVELLNAAAGAVLNTVIVTDSIIPATFLLAGQPAGDYNARVRAESAEHQSAFSSLIPLSFVPLSAPTDFVVV